MKALLFLFISFLFTAGISHAQDDRTDRLGIGIGPAKMYGDNTGVHSKFKFKVLPVLSLDYNKKIETNFDVKATLGWQMVNSGDFYNTEQIDKIAESNLPHAFRGNIYYADVMPVYHINPNQSGYLPSLIKVYTGLGLGYFYSQRTDERLILNDPLRRTETYSASDSGIYLPFRLGIYKDLQSDADIGLEATLVVSPFSELEGNDQQQKRIKSDMLMQFQFFYRIFIGK
ncbi:hypothetical protein [Cyclobacterium plantarum]|uniref:Outer membrane protein beta-barrel domain-containing protein n=1 Tax=Cyclobacterium plantarum TaxID=2716263 RepID=A0ABX0H116_9BACT|nr:hypothetical protein [Cyclobacterium plantarum]NHE55461.1 hypothetical protein [Cyclobacterium plantarum]